VTPGRIAAILLSSCGTAFAAAPDTLLSFTSCPIARDMGPDGELCFFVEHEGVAIGVVSRGFGSPQLLHQLLVEGRIVDGPPVCGGLPMEGRISVLPELDGNCNTIIPHDGKSKGRISGVFFTGGPEQRALAEDLTRRAQIDHRVTAEPAVYVPPPPPPPQPPFSTQTLVIHYPFGTDRGPGNEIGQLVRLAEYAIASRARSVTIVGQAASSRLSSGERLAESESLARTRAEKAAAILTGLGVPQDTVKVSWKPGLVEGTGDDDWRNRRIEVVLQP
jgi:hypothetical protein